MQFDILETIKAIHNHFGSASELTISSPPTGFAITVSTIHKGHEYRKRMTIEPLSLHQAEPSQKCNIMVNYLIAELKQELDRIDNSENIN